MKNKKIVRYILYFLIVIFTLISFTACDEERIIYSNETQILLSDDMTMVNGQKIGTSGNVFISNDIIYYEDRDNYESGNRYGLGSEEEKHTAEQAEKNSVINITKAGVYRLSGKLSYGQIRVDLGEKAYRDKSEKVTLILDGVDINCDVAPAILFMNVYECDNRASVHTTKKDVDTSAAGANLIIADGSINSIKGSHVAKILKDRETEKKLWKQDGAVYTYMSMNIYGEEENSGVLNINADKEGISSELHLTINGGNLNITAYDDGINVNEDLVSVVTINGGITHIIAGMSPIGGDGIDSNGWLVVNDGTLVSVGYRNSDTGVDNENGLFINGGTVVSLGHFIDYASHESTQKTLNLKYYDQFSTEDAITITDSAGNVVFCYDASLDYVVNPYISDRQGIIIASPNFVVGETYSLYMGGKVDGEHDRGLYDVSTIKGFTGARKQMYLSDEEFNRWGLYGEDEEIEYSPKSDFVFADTVNCFAEVFDSFE